MTEAQRSAVEQAMNSIRDRIRSGDWGPGHRLVESDLTVELGVSRGPLREALGRLSVEGLVTMQPHRGAMVSKLSIDDLRALYQVREVLEGLAARLVAERVDETDVREMATKELEVMRGSGRLSRQEYFDENSRFHGLLIEFSGNPHLLESTSRFGTQLYRYTMRALLDDDSIATSRAEHLAILDAVLAGKAAEAEALMRDHVHTSGQAVIGLLHDHTT